MQCLKGPVYFFQTPAASFRVERTLPETNSKFAPEKFGAWNTIVSF